jgi:two-component system, NarL family, response regulator NreC
MPGIRHAVLLLALKAGWMSTTITLADDHSIIRKGLRLILEAEPDLEVIGEAADGLEAAQLVERLKPDVLLLDLMMPGLSGLEVTRQVRRRSSRTRVVVLSMHGAEGCVLEALRAGAMGYVLKGSEPDQLITAIREAAAGRRYLSPPLSERAIEVYIERADTPADEAYATLTPREREVLHLAAEGYTNAEIAARLSISPRTAEKHRANLMQKLNLKSQTDLIRYALRRGILPPEG